ncbi:phosphotransferase family protein [Streptomyces palmae]|uniref:Aminoglycoside phosphotransferase family protein n=1 Tax=Streptomyces palmae TaxID=1701085 RepID=A0A4Z0HBY8_9ACTN|nr:phosphotransferase [Streptomyces palmae]TGB14962.1 aminoglycoside phosphotransferase family protein [Streptomyces palmae]
MHSDPKSTTTKAQVPIHGGFDEREMQKVLERACARVGLDSSDARLMRGHTNAVILLPKAFVVVKIARRGTPIGNVKRTVRFTRWLMDLGFPTAPLHPIDQPLIIDGHAATFWTYIPQPNHPVPAERLAKPLFSLHHLPKPEFDLPQHDNIRAIRRSINFTTSLSPATRRFLSEETDHLEASLKDVDFIFSEAVVQGDPQHRNALHAREGEALLCDWDTAAIGQPEWDLVTIEVHCRRFGYSKSHYLAFAESYGFDITQWAGFHTLRRIRELRMITTNARKAMHSPGSVTEVERRVKGLYDGDTQLRWRIL